MSDRSRVSGSDSTVSVVVVYDSGSRGHPAVGARACWPGGGQGGQAVVGTVLRLVPVAERGDHWEALDEADAIVFGCPTYMGSGSAELKAFMEETLRSRFLEQRWRDKLAAGFTGSAGMSGDKLLSLEQLAGFAAQHGMIWVTLGQLPGRQTGLGSAEDENRLVSGAHGAEQRQPGPRPRSPAERPGDRRALRKAHRGGGPPLGQGRSVRGGSTFVSAP